MIYKEEKRNLFSVDDSYYIAHCISADFALGAGITKEIDRRFNIREELKKENSDFYEEWMRYSNLHCIMSCIVIGRVINLVTKGRYYEKPTYNSLCDALVLMRIKCRRSKIKKIAMPLIGCGLDRLQWDMVSAMIKEIFADEDIEILVCVGGKKHDKL